MALHQFDVVAIDWSPRTSNVESLPATLGVLYGIYGDSPIYGGSVLLYIGQTTQTAKVRLQQHLQEDFRNQRNLSFSVGRVRELVAGVDPPTTLRICESILIASHKPSHNSQNLSGLHEQAMAPGRYVLLHNHGDRGPLALECSNFWWVSPA